MGAKTGARVGPQPAGIATLLKYPACAQSRVGLDLQPITIQPATTFFQIHRQAVCYLLSGFAFLHTQSCPEFYGF